MFRRILIAALAAVCLGAPADGGGYTYSGGYYWRDGVAYSLHSVPWYDAHCRCTRYRSEYRAVKFSDAYSHKIKAVEREAEYPSMTPEQFNAAVIEIAKQREEYDYKLESDRQNAEERRKTIEALGLGRGRNRSPERLESPAAGGYGVGAVTTTGTTVYGYPSVASVSQLYGDNVNLDQKLLEAQRAAVQSQRAADNANAGILKLIESVSSGRDAAAAILAAAQFKAASPAFQTTTTTQATAGASGQAGGSVAASPGGLRELISQRCASCHGAEKRDGESALFPGGLDMTRGIESYGDEQWAAILRKVGSGAMPPAPAEPLTLGELKLFLNARDF